MALRTYDPKKVTVVIGGVPMSGFADGTFLSIIRSEDAFTKVTGADGDTSRAKSNNRDGEATLTLLQTSPSNDILTGFAQLDERENGGVVSFTVKDLSGRSTFVSAFAWIRKLPDSEYGKEISDREWVFELADMDMFVGGNTQA